MPNPPSLRGLSIASVCFSLACGPTIHDPVELTPGLDDERPASDAAGEDPPPRPPQDPDESSVHVPTPEELGFSIDPDSRVLQPTFVSIEASAVRQLRPDVVRLELMTDLDLTGDPDDYYAWSWEVRGHGPGCGPGGTVLARGDAHDASRDVSAPLDLLAAIAKDIDAAPRPTCEAEPKHDEFAPFGPGFWQVEPCKEKAWTEKFSRNLILLAIPEILLATPGWTLACAAHVIPDDIAECESKVYLIDSHLIAAEKRVFDTGSVLALMDELTGEALEIADDLNLGFAGPANAVDIAELAFLALEVYALRIVAEHRANLANSSVVSAHVTAESDGVIWAAGAGAFFTWFSPAVLTWVLKVETLATCYDRVTSWIATVAAVGFGIRAFRPPNLFFDPQSDASGSDESLLLAGPRRVQSLQYFFSDEIVIDIDTLTSEEHAATWRAQDGNVSRVVFGGYDTPGYDHALPRDLVVPDPWTMFPIVWAPEGTPIWPGETGYGGPSQEVFPVTYSEAADIVWLGALGLELNVQETDASGAALTQDLWALCNASDPPDVGYCPLGVPTTVPPDDYGTRISRYFRVWVTGGIIDPENGNVIEPEGSQFFVSVHASGEGPQNECYVWNEASGAYAYDPSAPGCGPTGGAEGGGDDGGGGPPPG